MRQPRKPSIDDSTHEVIGLLRELLHASLEASAPAWIELPLTLPQLRTAFVIAHERGSSLAAIARRLGVGEPTASHLVDRLVRAGLADRREDPVDRRRLLIQLSPAGEELIERLFGWEGLLGGWLQRMDEGDLSILRDGLRAVVTAANKGTEPSNTPHKA